MKALFLSRELLPQLTLSVLLLGLPACEAEGRPEPIGGNGGSSAVGSGGAAGPGAGGDASLGPGGDGGGGSSATDPGELCAGDWSIDSRADLEALAAANCASIGGSVVVGDSWKGNAPDDLSALAQVKSIGGDLHLLRWELDSLAGLEALESVAGSLIVEYCDELTTLSGLENIAELGGDLQLRYNKRLKSLEPLDGWAMDTVAGAIEVNSHASLPQCSVDALLVQLDAECRQPAADFCQLLNEGAGSCN